jgi:formate dehydrogenase accessory protein FdhE
VRNLWDAAMARAERLAEADVAAAAVLRFAAHLARVQRDIYVGLSASRPAGGPSLTGRLDADLSRVRPLVQLLLESVAAHGPDPLARGAADLQQADPAAIDELLIEYWRVPRDDQFFPKACLQPYARALADARIPPIDRDASHADNRCPFCGGRPQLAVLRATETQADGGRRHLLCATCLTVWPFRRIRCPHCGEEDEPKLGYFHASAYPHVRVEACDTCGHYLKAVDLAQAGLAVPLVDEIAASALDIWAREQGYVKIERNLIGL